MVARHVVASISAARMKTAARSCHAHDAHSRRASAAAWIARSTCSLSAPCQSASTCAWSCGITA